GRVVTAGCHDTGGVDRSSVEPQSSHIHGWPAAPTVSNRIVDLRNVDRGGEWSRAPEEVEFPLIYRAARPCHWRGHDRPSGPSVGADVVDVQCVHLCAAVVTAGNIELAVDDSEPGEV